LEQALAAAERDTTTRFAIERAILLHLVEHLLHRHHVAEQVQRSSGTDGHRLLAARAGQIATMQEHGLAALAGYDDDADRVPGITRYAPA
jgi:predicted nucleic acid-binding protein